MTSIAMAASRPNAVAACEMEARGLGYWGNANLPLLLFVELIMLKVTVEVVGQNGSTREIATAYIARLKRSATPDYVVRLREDQREQGGKRTLHAYPRHAASIFDLVARALAVGLTGTEELPSRPKPLSVPIHRSGNTDYVRLGEIPEPAATLLRKRIEYSGCPVIEEDPTPMDCAYASDWFDFLTGCR